MFSTRKVMMDLNGSIALVVSIKKNHKKVTYKITVKVLNNLNKQWNFPTMLLTVLQIRMAIKFFKKVGIRFFGNFQYVSRETYLLFFVLSLCSPHAYIIMGT